MFFSIIMKEMFNGNDFVMLPAYKAGYQYYDERSEVARLKSFISLAAHFFYIRGHFYGHFDALLGH